MCKCRLRRDRGSTLLESLPPSSVIVVQVHFDGSILRADVDAIRALTQQSRMATSIEETI
jgi:hypothetical protein